MNMPSLLRALCWWRRDPEVAQCLDDYEGLADEVEFLQVQVDDLRSRVLRREDADE